MMKTRIFNVRLSTLVDINEFLRKSTTGALMRQEFTRDEEGRLYLIVTIVEEDDN